MTNIKRSLELSKMQQTYIEVSILLCAMSVRLKKECMTPTGYCMYIKQSIYM